MYFAFQSKESKICECIERRRLLPAGSRRRPGHGRVPVRSRSPHQSPSARRWRASPFMEGVWRGPAWTATCERPARATFRPSGRRAFLDGSVKVIEGRGYMAGRLGRLQRARRYFLRFRQSCNLQHELLGAGLFRDTFRSVLTADGYVWETPGVSGCGDPLHGRRSATATGARIGERVAGDAPPVQIFESEPAPVRGRHRLARGRRGADALTSRSNVPHA